MSDNGQSKNFEPEITVFTCNYCGYMSIDTAGTLRLQYPPNIKLVRLPCTGKTEVRYILEAFEQGADGVYVIAVPWATVTTCAVTSEARFGLNGPSSCWMISVWVERGWKYSSSPAGWARPLPATPKR